VGKTTVARWQPTATLLSDGTVLLAGGDGLGTAELFDPLHGSFTPTGRMTSPRNLASATLLQSGQVLITGGEVYTPLRVLLATAELYDPATRRFTVVGEMTKPRSRHIATSLPDGRALVIDGDGDAELYDPATTGFAPARPFSPSPSGRTATPLPSGRVLAIGERGSELFDPETGIVTASGPMATSRQSPSATLLPTGKVLVGGGFTDGGLILATSELYDPGTGVFTPGPALLAPRAGHLAMLLPSGAVLVAGGMVMSRCADPWDYDCGPAESDSAELLDPALGTATVTGSMSTPRSFSFPFTPLQDGRVLVTGLDPAGTVEAYR